jgi:hypothetical protein
MSESMPFDLDQPEYACSPRRSFVICSCWHSSVRASSACVSYICCSISVMPDMHVKECKVGERAEGGPRGINSGQSFH